MSPEVRLDEIAVRPLGFPSSDRQRPAPLRHLQALAHLCSRYSSALLRSEIVKQVENIWAHCAPEYIFGVYLGTTFADYSG